MRSKKSICGYTLIEMMVILVIAGVLLTIAGSEVLKTLHSENLVKAAAKDLIMDLKTAENEALRRGGGEMVDPGTGLVLAKKSIFAVFSAGSSSYAVVAYTDANGNNKRDDASVDTYDNVIPSKKVENNVKFGMLSSVNKSACENAVAGTPASTVTFAADSNPPCDSDSCLELDANGFPKFTGSTTSGQIYLTNGTDAYAISMNAAGLMTLCKWDGKQWQITH